MVKGISRQVIMVQPPDRKLFEQAIFVLNEDSLGEGITDEALLKEAREVIRSGSHQGKRRKLWLYGPFWAAGGSLITGLVWLATVIW